MPLAQHSDVFAREPFTTWRKKNMVRILMQTGRKRDPRMPDVPTIHELMNEYNTAGHSVAGDADLGGR